MNFQQLEDRIKTLETETTSRLKARLKRNERTPEEADADASEAAAAAKRGANVTVAQHRVMAAQEAAAAKAAAVEAPEGETLDLES